MATSHICFHQKSTTLAYFLEVTVIHSLYVQINYVNPLLSPGAYFVFLLIINSVFLLLYLLYYSTITFASVICSNNKESSGISVDVARRRDVLKRAW